MTQCDPQNSQNELLGENVSNLKTESLLNRGGESCDFEGLKLPFLYKVKRPEAETESRKLLLGSVTEEL